MKIPLLAAMVLLASPLISHAQITISVTGTANSTGLGYTSGNPYSFTYTLASSFGDNGTSFFSATQNFWREFHVPDDSLWTAVTGDGLAGVYIQPEFDDTDPHSFLELHTNVATPGSDFVEVSASSQHSNIGLTANGEALSYVYFQLSNSGASFLYPGVHTDPATILGANPGTYTPTGGSSGLTVRTVFGNQVHFTLSSMTISAVPEPSTYAILAGLAALGLAAWRRRAVSAARSTG